MTHSLHLHLSHFPATINSLHLHVLHSPCFTLPQNGDPFVNYLSVTPIHDASGRLTHYVGIQSDITELVNHKKAELAAKHAALQVRITLQA